MGPYMTNLQVICTPQEVYAVSAGFRAPAVLADGLRGPSQAAFGQSDG
jgi:hypothetical protein